jgi:hypothetical protein
MTATPNGPSTARPARRPAPALTPPATLEERLQRIEAMGQRITGYVEFMCQVCALAGTSAEAKERAVTAFHDRMVVAEKQLGQVHDDLRLG